MSRREKYVREHWREWIRRDILRIGYWPQYREWQTEWVRFDAKEIVRQLVDGKIDVLHWGVPENWYPVDAGFSRRHPALAALGRDPFQEIVEECHRHGKKICFYFASNSTGDGQFEYYERHRDVLRAQGFDIRDDEPIPTHFRLCLENPGFLDPFFETIRAILDTYEIDGFALDGPWADEHWNRAGAQKDGRLTCRFCRESFEKFTGDTLIPKEDWSDPAWHRYLAWKEHQVLQFQKRLRDFIWAVDERLFLGVNNNIAPHQNRVDPNRAAEGIACAQFETVLNGAVLLESSMKMKLGWAATGTSPGNTHKSADLNPGGLADADPSAVDVATLAYVGLVHGGWTEFHSTMDQYGRPHPLRTRVYQQVGREIARKKPWLVRSRPCPHAGIFYSWTTARRYAGANVPAFLHAFLGAERLLTESHIYGGYLLNGDLTAERLREYGCIILPNTACMSDRQVEAVREYVKNGGGLVATNETSLYDEQERFRGDFGLADVFGVHFGGVSSAARKVTNGKEPMWKRYPYRIRKHPLTRGLEEADLDLTWLPYFRVEKSGEYATIATWPVLEENTIWPVNTGRFIKADADEPCIVAGRYGKGRVVYISSDYTGFYVTRSMGTTRRLFAQMVEWVAPVSIRADCPKSIEMTVLRQEGKNHRVIHLLNCATFYKGNDNMLAQGGYFSAGTYRPHAPMETLRYQKRTDMPGDLAELAQRWRIRPGALETGICDEVIPVFGARLLVNEKKFPLKRACMVPERKPLAIRRRKGVAEITVPRLDIHRMVV